MNILIASHRFYPDVGGIETVTDILAREFALKGHNVIVVTQSAICSEPGTPLQQEALLSNEQGRLEDDGTQENLRKQIEEFPFQIIRRPNRSRWLALMNWCDVYWQSNISLQTLWPWLVTLRPWKRKPLIITHHTWLYPLDQPPSWQGRLKQWCLRWARGISISQAIADHIPAPSVILGNPYRDDVFRLVSDVIRDREIIFVGRLVSDKGADVLLEALSRLAQQGLKPQMTIVGDGPERPSLEEFVRQRGLQQQVIFAGFKTGTELAQYLNRHHLIAIPSRWAEPFGLVALEGIACGCVAVGSDLGGLPEAIGACGVTVPNGDAERLASQLAQLLQQPECLQQYRSARANHLEHFRRAQVAQTYLDFFEETLCLTP